MEDRGGRVTVAFWKLRVNPNGFSGLSRQGGGCSIQWDRLWKE